MSGWMPISRRALTLCWVGLVFTSPAVLMKGTQVRWMKMAFSLAHLVAELPDGLQKGEAFDVADGAADFDDGHVDSRRRSPE